MSGTVPQGQDQNQGHRGSPPRQQRSGGQGRAQGGQHAEMDPSGNFMLGPHITSVNVSQNYGAVQQDCGVTVHREPLRNLPTSIPIPRVEEDSEDSSSAITNSTQQMVSTLTSLGSSELSRLSHWSPTKEIRGNPKKKRSKNIPENRRTDDVGVVTMGVVNIAMEHSCEPNLI